MRWKKSVTCLLCGTAFLAEARGEAILQLFNVSWNELSQKMPEIAEAGYTGLWLPPAAKANSQFSAGYDLFDPFDLGDKDQKGTIATRYGTKDELLRMVRMAHRFGLRVYFDTIMNHRSYDVPGYDAYTPITVYPGLLPEDFHLRVTSDGFYRKWDNISDWSNTWQIQHRNFSDLVDLAQETSINENFGLTEGSTSPKISFIRQPNNPEYYMDSGLPQIDPGSTSWHPFNGTNGVPVIEDTAAFLIRGALWFLNETKCDGLRLDAVKHVPATFFGDYLSATPNGYCGAIQVMFDYVHGYGYNNPISGYNETTAANGNAPDNRDSCFDAERVRNDALIFGEHLGEPPSFSDYTSRGMRLVDAPLVNTLNNILGSVSTGLQGLDQVGYDGYSYLNQYTRVMYAQSHDNGYANHRELQLPYMHMREGLPVIYSDGWHKSANCTQCGGEFPRNANASYLGEFGDNKMPNIATLHNQLARGGSRPRWSDNDVVAFERYDYREGSGSYDDPTLTTVLFVMNDNYCSGSNYDECGDVSFDDSVPQNDSGMPSTCYPVKNTRGVGLAVGFPPGSVLVQMADSPYANRACPKLLVRNATSNYGAATNSINASNPIDRLVYVGGQYIPPGGGAIEFKIPRGGYVIYAYQGSEASRPASGVLSNNAITLVQGGVEAPRMIVRRSTGPDGDQSYNPSFPFRMRGSFDVNGNVIGGQNVSNFTYAIDIPVITNSTPFDIVVRTDGSATNVLVKLDGGMDINSQMGLGPQSGFDKRDNKPGYVYDMFLGYEQTAFQFLYGPEKFGATNVSNDTIFSPGAETYHYTIGGSGTIVTGTGGGLGYKTQTADWVYHEPTVPVNALGGPATQRDPLNPTAGTNVAIYVKVGYQFQVSKLIVYYTTDGSNPEGAFGVGRGTTQVVQGTWFGDDLSDGTIDWWKATIPGQSSGTVKYKVAVFKTGASIISDADSAKLYALRQAAITNFNPAAATVWLHSDLNTNSTATGLEPGYHIVRARPFLPRDGKSSVFNAFLQTFYYDPAPPNGIIAYPANNGDTLGSQQYGVVVRADPTTTEVEYNIMDSDPTNDDPATGNGLTNGLPAFAKATQVSPTPELCSACANYPLEFRFNYVGVPSGNNTGTITARLKEITTATFTNRYTELVRTVNCNADPRTLTIRCPGPDCFGSNHNTISLDQNDKYTIVTCYTDTLGTDINKFTIKIDGAIQARTKADGTQLYYINDVACGAGSHALRFDWGGMSAGLHHIETLYDDVGVHLQASRDVTVNIISGITVNIISPPDADAAGRSPYTITLPDKTNATPAERSFTIVTETSTSVTNVLISFNVTTNAFSGGAASNDTSFVGTTLRWNFAWTNMIPGIFTIRADALGGGSNAAFRIAQVVFNQAVAASDSSDDDDNDGLNDLTETTAVSLPSGQSELWLNGQVHQYYFSGKTDPANCDTDNDGLPDALELGLESSIATNTDLNADTNGDGYKNFIADTDPPRYNTIPDNGQYSNSNPPPGYSYWNYDEFGYHANLLAGTVTDPNNPDTDYDGLMDGVEDANRNGRVDIALTNATGTVTNTIAHPPTFKASSRIDRNTVLLKFPNAVWLETDPNNPDSDADGLLDGAEDANHNGRIDGDTNTNRVWNAGELWTETDPLNPDTDGDGLPDGWEVQHGLDPWDDGVIGHTNMHTGATITTTTNGASGDPDSDGCNNQCEYLNGTDPWVPNDAPPPPANSITIGPGPVIGTTGGVTWYQEFQDWTADDLKALDEYDGVGSLYQNRDVYPFYDGYDWSRDIIAFYARDGGSDGKYYFRVDFHDLAYKAEQANLDVYVAINFGIPGDSGTANIVLPDEIDTKTDMGWKVVVAAYDTNNGRVYVKRQGIDTAQGACQVRSYTPDPSGGGFVGSYYRSDLDTVEFAISRQALIDAGWNGTVPLEFQVFTTRDGTCNSCNNGSPGAGDTPKSGSDITDSIFDDNIAESYNPTPPNDTIYYFFTSINQNPVTKDNYQDSLVTTNRPNTAKVAFLLHGNQAILPASIIQNLIYSTNQTTTTGTDTNYDPGMQPTGYHRALDSANVFNLPLNLHLSGSLISALQWAKSDPALDPTGLRDGPAFNQRIASMVASGKVSLVSGMFADHIAQYFTGAVNRAAVQLQDDIMRTVYGSNSVSANTPVYLAERVVDGKTLSDLAANSGHNFTVLDQIVHLWWWGEQLYGFGNGRQTALGDGGYQINKFNNMKAFMISAASDQMYLYNDLGATIALRELLNRKARSSIRDQVVVLADNWETAGGAGGGNHNPDALNLTMRWIANHQWIKAVRLDKFGTAQEDINNDGTINSNTGIYACVDSTADNPCVNDRNQGVSNPYPFTSQAKDLIRHNSRTNYDNWYYGLTNAEESFYSKKPPLRTGLTTTKILGHVLTNGTILADTWFDVQASSGALSNLAKLVYLNGIFETAFHDDDNNDSSRFSTGDYRYPDTTGNDALSTFAYKPNSHATRQASIVAAASVWAATDPSTIPSPVTAQQDVDQGGDNEYVLYDGRIYAVFERLGGRMIAAFARDTNSWGSAYQVMGNLASTPDFESEEEGDTNVKSGQPYAYRTSGFKDWWAIVSGVGTNKYVNDLYTAVAISNGWQFTSSDGKITKTITIPDASNKLEASYNLSGVSTLYVRHGLSPNLADLLYSGQSNLQPLTNTGVRVILINSNSTSVVNLRVNYADADGGHSNVTYNASASDDGVTGGAQFNMRNQAQTIQVELVGTGPAFSFGLALAAFTTNPNTDSVGDGIPDWWRAQYFPPGNGSTTNNPGSCATCDPDYDGMNNLAEYTAGTIPTNSTSVLRILSITRQGGGYQVTWTSISGRKYDLYATSDLASSWGSPINLPSPLTASGATTSYTDSPATGNRKFYKVKVVP